MHYFGVDKLGLLGSVGDMGWVALGQLGIMVRFVLELLGLLSVEVWDALES